MSALSAQRLRKSLPRLTLTRTIFVIAGGWLLLQQILTEVSTFDGQPDRPPLGSVAYISHGLEVAFFALLITVWWAPRVSYFTGALLFPWMSLNAYDFRLAWMVLALISTLGLVRTLIADARSQPSGPLQSLPKIDRFTQTAAGERTLGWYVNGVVGLLCLIAIPVMLLWHASAVQDLAHFEASARTVEGTITSFDDGEEWVTVEYDGKSAELEWWFPVGSRAVGEHVDLLVAGERVALADDPGDPSWMLGVAAAVPAVAAATLGQGPLREWQRRRLLRRGGRQSSVRAISTGTDVRLLPVNASGPSLRLRNAHAVDETDSPPDNELDDEWEEDDWDEEEWEEPDPPAPTTTTELIELANDTAEFNEIFEQESDGWDDGCCPTTDGVEHFTLTGSWRWGNSIALTSNDGRVWIGEIAEGGFWQRDGSSLSSSVVGEEHPDLESALESYLLRHPSFAYFARWGATLGTALVLGALSAALFADSGDLLGVVFTTLYSVVFLLGWPVLAGMWFDGMIMPFEPWHPILRFAS